MKRSFWLLVPLLLTVAFASNDAWAAPSYKDRLAARKLVRQAKKLARLGKHSKAAKKYKKADKRVPSLNHKLGRAQQLVKAGDLVKAGTVLEKAQKKKRVFRWADKMAMRKIKKLAQDVEERVPTLTINVVEPTASDVTVTVDDDDFEVADGAVNFNPGRYRVVAKAKGYKKWSKKVRLDEGDEKTLSITMTPIKAKVDPDAAKSGKGISRVPAYVAWGIGVAGIAAGIGFGVAAVQSTSDVRTLYNCKENKCPVEAEEDLAVAKMNGNISTAGWIVAGVGAAAGTILFLVSGGDSEEGVDKDGDAGMLKIEARPVIGPGYLGVTGRF